MTESLFWLFFFPRGEFLLEGREQRESEGEHRAASLMGGGGQRELERVISVTAGRQWTPPAFSATKVAFTEISVYHFHFTKTQWY